MAIGRLRMQQIRACRSSSPQSNHYPDHEDRIIDHTRDIHWHIGPVPGCVGWMNGNVCECDDYRLSGVCGPEHHNYNYGCDCKVCEEAKKRTYLLKIETERRIAEEAERREEAGRIVRERRKKARDRIYGAKYRAKNREAIAKKSREAYARNKTNKRKYRRTYARMHPEVEKAKSHKYYINNREMILAKNRAYKAKKKAAK